jgi:hypothetical protein
VGAEEGDEPCKKRFRKSGAGRKSVAPEIREVMFEWFVDVRGTLKGRLPRKIFRLKCLEFYNQWMQLQNNPPERPLAFSNRWIASWMQEYHVSLNKPNKRFALQQDERKLRIVELLKNIWRIRCTTSVSSSMQSLSSSMEIKCLYTETNPHLRKQ